MAQAFMQNLMQLKEGARQADLQYNVNKGNTAENVRQANLLNSRWSTERTDKLTKESDEQRRKDWLAVLGNREAIVDSDVSIDPMKFMKRHRWVDPNDQSKGNEAYVYTRTPDEISKRIRDIAFTAMAKSVIYEDIDPADRAYGGLKNNNVRPAHV
jgi:hypothetical protein